MTLSRQTVCLAKYPTTHTYGVFAWLLVSILAASPAHAFKIQEPAEKSRLSAGQTITARVDQGQDTGIVTVRYYW
jgi:hypothetical protein